MSLESLWNAVVELRAIKDLSSSLWRPRANAWFTSALEPHQLLCTLVFGGKCKYFSLTPFKTNPNPNYNFRNRNLKWFNFLSCLHRQRSQDLQCHALQREAQIPAKSRFQIWSQTGPGTDILPQREAAPPWRCTHPCTYTHIHRLPCSGSDTFCSEGSCMIGSFVHLRYTVSCVHHALTLHQGLTLQASPHDTYLMN